ncbi:MAG: Hpt domain-containing protein [Thiohalospira sp.]
MTRPEIDWKLAIERAGGQEALATDLHAMLLAELPGHIEVLDQALASTDRRHLADPVHRVTGSCRYCGVPRLEAAAEALNARLKAGDNPPDDAIEPVIEAARALLHEQDSA